MASDGSRQTACTDSLNGARQAPPALFTTPTKPTQANNTIQARADQAPPIRHHWPTPSTTGQQQAPPTTSSTAPALPRTRCRSRRARQHRRTGYAGRGPMRNRRSSCCSPPINTRDGKPARQTETTPIQANEARPNQPHPLTPLQSPAPPPPEV